MLRRPRISRRTFLKLTGATAAAVSLAKKPDIRVFAEPSTRLSGQLKILLWSHFVPSHDVWFDEWARAWGEEVGVEVTVDHIGLADLPAAVAGEINAESGHDLIEFLSPPSAFEPSLLDLTDVNQEAISRWGEPIGLATRNTFNPTTGVYYGFCHSWVPDPGNYRQSLWDAVGKPEGPETWQDLIDYGGRILNEQGIQLGVGMSNELDSNMAARALIWSFGGSIQDENEQVVINSPEVIEAVEFMKELYEAAMTPEVFGWTAASNNELLVAGQASYILNSISAYRSGQADNPEVARDVFFSPALKGPRGDQWVGNHVVPIYFVPKHSQNVDAAKEFMLHVVANSRDVVYESKLYNFPSYLDQVPELFEEGGWLDEDPHGSEPANKLQALKTAPEWSTSLGYPGPANAAEGEVFATFVLPNMLAQAARGEKSAAEAVADAEEQINAIFEKWRDQGFIGGGSE